MITRQDLKELWELLHWQDTKTALVDHANLSRDALHVYIALMIYLGSCWLFKWHPRSWKPWLLVLLFQTVNEVFDMRVSFEDDGVIWVWGNIKDMVNTMVAPTMLLFAARCFKVFEAKPKTPKAPSGDKPEV